GQDGHYAYGLAMALAGEGVYLDFMGSDELDSPELHASPRLRFLNLQGGHGTDESLARKMLRVLLYYTRLVWYAALAKPKIFHVLWNNKFELFDRTLLMPYYKLLGKKIAFTAHNINIGQRDSADTLLNRLTLRIQYRLADHIFVHTERMNRDLQQDFEVCELSIRNIPYGLNNSVPDTILTPGAARRALGVGSTARTILFFGAIAPYKG